MTGTAIFALVLWTIFVACVAFVAGGFHEYDREGGSQETRRELRKAWLENEELKELLWVLTEHPSVSRYKPAGALPKSTVTVERSRHLHSVRITNGGGA